MVLFFVTNMMAYYWFITGFFCKFLILKKKRRKVFFFKNFFLKLKKWFQPQKSCITSKVNIFSSFFEKCVFLFSRSQPIRCLHICTHDDDITDKEEAKLVKMDSLNISFYWFFNGLLVWKHPVRMVFHRNF